MTKLPPPSTVLTNSDRLSYFIRNQSPHKPGVLFQCFAHPIAVPLVEDQNSSPQSLQQQVVQLDVLSVESVLRYNALNHHVIDRSACIVVVDNVVCQKSGNKITFSESQSGSFFFFFFKLKLLIQF